MTKNTIPLSHPGETIREDYMEPLGLTPYKMAKLLGVQQTALAEILAGKRGISPEMALRLAVVTNTDAQSWLNLQAHYDLEKARDNKAIQKKLKTVHSFDWGTAADHELALAG